EFPVRRRSPSTHPVTLSDDEVVERCQEIARVFTTVERMLQEENLGTFGHMISRAHELLHQDNDLLTTERARARFILVDEFQDAKFASVILLYSISGQEVNVVTDCDAWTV